MSLKKKKLKLFCNQDASRNHPNLDLLMGFKFHGPSCAETGSVPDFTDNFELFFLERFPRFFWL